MIVAAFVDPKGTTDYTDDDEYQEIKNFIENILDREVIFKKKIRPFELANQPCDIYFFDYGGLGPGQMDTTISYYHSLIDQIEDHPNVLFVLWSSFTFNWYKEIINDDFNSKVFHNISLGDGDEIIQKLIKMGILMNEKLKCPKCGNTDQKEMKADFMDTF